MTCSRIQNIKDCDEFGRLGGLSAQGQHRTLETSRCHVCSQGQSGRTGDMAWESVVSQMETCRCGSILVLYRFQRPGGNIAETGWSA